MRHRSPGALLLRAVLLLCIAAQLERFGRFLDYLRRTHVSVRIVLVPYNPIVYREFVQRTPNPVAVAEQTIRSMAQRGGAKVVGGFDPATTRATSDDFFDQSHMRAPSLARIVTGQPSGQ